MFARRIGWVDLTDEAPLRLTARSERSEIEHAMHPLVRGVAPRLADAAHRAPGLSLFALAAISYFALARYIIWLNDPFQVGAGFWPAAGLTVALLLRTPSTRWPWVLGGVVLAETASDLIHDYPAAGIPWWVTGNAVGPLVGAALLRRIGSERGDLVPIGNLLAFVGLGVVVGPLIGATIGSIGTVGSSELGWADVWPKYVVGDALGVLVVAPVVLTSFRTPSARSTLEATLLFAGLTLASVATFADWPASLELVSASFTIPFLTWAAVRFGMRGAAWSVFLLAQIANLANAFGYGPFADLASSPAAAVTVLQVFLLVAASSAFVLAALVHELSGREQVERVLRDLADAMPQLVWIAADDGTVEYSNQRRRAYLPAASSDGELDWNLLIHPDDLERAQSAFHLAREGDAVYECEQRLRMADGSYRWHLSRAERLESVGRPQWYGTSTDIHEMKLADQLKDEFIAVASHELRNPVAAIHGSTQLLHRSIERGQLTPERLESYTRALVDRSTYLARLTHDLMDVSRLQRGDLPLQIEATDVRQLVAAAASATEWLERRVRQRVEGNLTLRLDPARTQQVLSNLLDNALKYSESDTVVEICAHVVEDGVVIEVVDHGIGLPPGEHDRIFTQFGRGANVGSVGGLGMGLYVAREITERQGGKLSAISGGERQGTTMRVWFPSTLRVHATETATAEGSAEASGTEAAAAPGPA